MARFIVSLILWFFMFVTLAKVYCVKNYAAAQKGYQQVRQLKERYRRAVFSDHVLHKISRPTGVSNKKGMEILWQVISCHKKSVLALCSSLEIND